MSATTLPNATLTAAYEAMTPGSAALAASARELLPSGIAHDSRHFDPYPLYITRAQGPVKWDVDGNKYVDYFGGHGALILGHNHPAVIAAVHAALDRGTHFGACHELEVRWAELITQMVPSAERVRFTSSGTEATLMALRLARAFTGRQKLRAVPRPFPWLARPHGQRLHEPFRRHADHRRAGRASPTTCCWPIRTTSRAIDAHLQRPQGHRRGDPRADRRQLRQDADRGRRSCGCCAS